MRLYVGNLAYTATDADLREAFESHGELVSTLVVMDRDTGRSRGFGFVEYADDQSARNAMTALDGTDMGGRTLRVNEAHERGGGGGGGGGRGGGGGGGGRY